MVGKHWQVFFCAGFGCGLSDVFGTFFSSVFTNTADGLGTPLRKVAKGEFFG